MNRWRAAISAAVSAWAGKSQSNDEKYLSATVTTGEQAQGRWKGRSPDYQLVARCTQLVLTFATMNATACSSYKMRMYAPAKSRTARKHYRRAIKGKARNDYLRMTSGGPGTRAATFAENSGEVVEIIDHPALDLLDNPNPFMRGSLWQFHCFMQWEITGRRFTHIIERGGRPIELWPMLCQFVKLIPSRHGLIDGYVYGRDGTVQDVFDNDEVLYHRFRPSPFNPFDSIGPLHSITKEADIYTAATISELATWENQGRPDWVLPISADAPESVVKQLRAEAEKLLKGPRNRGKMLIAPLDALPQALQFTPKEMEYLLGKRDLRSVFRSAFGVPEAMDEMNSANLASSDNADPQYARYTIKPRLNMNAEEWTDTLLYQHFGLEPGTAWFGYENPVKEDRANLRQDIQVFVPMGVWNVNEARAKLGEEPIEGGDEYRDPTPPPQASGAGGPDRGQDQGQDKPTKPEGKAAKRISGKDVDIQPPDLTARAQAAANALDTAVNVWLQGASDAIEPPATPEGAMGILDPFKQGLQDAMYRPVADLLTEGLRVGASEIGKPHDPFTVYEPAISNFLDNYTVKLADTISDTAEEGIRDAIRKGLETGQTLGETSHDVRAIIKAMAPWKATQIARTEAAVATDLGKAEAWRANGYKRVQRVLASNCCPACTAFNEAFGDTRDIDKPFAKAGEAFNVPGREKPFVLTRDVWSAVLHPNDRCFLQPVNEIDDDEEGAAP